MIDRSLEALEEQLVGEVPAKFPSLRDLARSAVLAQEKMQTDYICSLVQQTFRDVLTLPPLAEDAIDVEAFGGQNTEARAKVMIEGLVFQVRALNLYKEEQSCVLEMRNVNGSWTKVDGLLDVGHELRKIEAKEQQDGN